MQLDFWNNPLVVSAFRVQYRRGGLFSVTVVYLLLWAVIGGALEYYQSYVGPDWPRMYFLGLVGAQSVISGMIAMNATNSSIRTEVVRRTLDFQRITALSLSELLIGKLLCDTPLAYPLFGYEIPYILLTPLTQLLVAYVCFHVMERRFVNPANPPFRKRLAYATLALVDVLVAAALFTRAPAGGSFGVRAAGFCVSHLL